MEWTPSPVCEPVCPSIHTRFHHSLHHIIVLLFQWWFKLLLYKYIHVTAALFQQEVNAGEDTKCVINLQLTIARLDCMCVFLSKYPSRQRGNEMYGHARTLHETVKVKSAGRWWWWWWWCWCWCRWRCCSWRQCWYWWPPLAQFRSRRTGLLLAGKLVGVGRSFDRL